MCRVYFTGAYRNPRELNWLIGVALMFFTIFFGFSGYILPWDSLAFGAATIGISMASSTPLIGGWMATALFCWDYIDGTNRHTHVLPTCFHPPRPSHGTNSCTPVHSMGTGNGGAALRRVVEWGC